MWNLQIQKWNFVNFKVSYQKWSVIGRYCQVFLEQIVINLSTGEVKITQELTLTLMKKWSLLVFRKERLKEMAGWWPSHARQADSAGGPGEGLPLWFVAAMKVSVSQSSELRACISLLSEDPEVCSLTLTALLCNPRPDQETSQNLQNIRCKSGFPFYTSIQS